MENKLVSVIIPVYNVKKYAYQCISSVINQTYKNLEIILVDDGSTDGSGNICDSFGELDNRIKVIHKKNSGLGLSRNAGLDLASGDYIYFIDSDDFISEDIIQKLMSEISTYQLDTIIGGYIRTNEEGKELYSKKYNSVIYRDNEVKTKLLPKLIGSSPYKKDSIRMSVWNVMFSKKVVKENNVKFVSERKYISEDIIWDMDYYNKAKKVKLVNYDGYYYRVRSNSLTKQFNYEKRILQIRDLYLYEKGKLLELGIFQVSKERLAREFFINLSACISQIVRKNNFITGSGTILELMNDNFIRKIILNYPYKKTNFKSKVFLELFVKKRAKILFILFKVSRA